MSIKSDIEEAIKVHAAWKARFRDFLNGKTGMDLEAVSHTDACKLGHWLEDGGLRMLSPEDHSQACALHAQFHQVAGDIVHNIKQKNFESARNALVSSGLFDQASHALCAHLHKIALHEASKPTAKTTHDNPDSPSSPAIPPVAIQPDASSDSSTKA